MPTQSITTTEQPTQWHRNSRGMAKCQAPTGTAVAREPEPRPQTVKQLRNPMVKHEPELHKSIDRQFGRQVNRSKRQIRAQGRAVGAELAASHGMRGRDSFRQLEQSR